MRFAIAVSFLGSVAAFGLIGCGESSTTTVVESTPPPPVQTVVQTVPAAPPAPEAKAAAAKPAEPAEAPDVVGLSLPEAKKQLSAAGYRTDASNTDTTFGIIVEENYTVCEQDDPRGNVVHVLAQKYGC